jgi:hypothetical protein
MVNARLEWEFGYEHDELIGPPGAVVERMSGAPADVMSQLSARGIRHIYVDGGITIQRFLQVGASSASSSPAFRC